MDQDRALKILKMCVQEWSPSINNKYLKEPASKYKIDNNNIDLAEC